MVDFKVNQKTEQMQQSMQELLKANLELKMKSSLDSLTGIPNRRHIDEYIDGIWDEAKKKNQSVGIAIIDADFFKRINDNYGHDAGDCALIKIAEMLAETTDGVASMVGRYGGEEFIAVFYNRNINEVLKVLESFRETLERLEIQYKEAVLKITVSMGLAFTIPKNDLQIRDLVRKADTKLYEAKKNGRNNLVYVELNS